MPFHFVLQIFLPFRFKLQWLLVVLNATKRNIHVLNSATFHSNSDENHHVVLEIKTLVCF
jgi:hypothetical protein